MVVPNVVVLEAVDLGEPAHVVGHLVDVLCVSWGGGEHVGDVVPGEMMYLS